MKTPIAIAAMAMAAGLIGLPAAAQDNSKAPLDVTADSAVMHNADCTQVWSGSAEALRDTSRLRSDVMVVHMEVKKGKQAPKANGEAGGSCGDMVSVEAKGNVFYVTGDGRRVHGDNGFYDAANTTVTITGDVTAVDAQNNVMRGTKMVYNTKTGEGHVEGGAKGPNGKNRPRGVFYPKDSDKTDAAAPGVAGDAAAKPKKAAK